MDPLLAYKEGGFLAVAAVLFIFNFMQNFGLKKSNEALVEAVRESNSAAVTANRAVVTQLTEMAQTLAEGQSRATQDLTAVLKNQELLATNQMNLTHTNNNVVRELITIIRDGERS